jgi:hypothetical protein
MNKEIIGTRRLPKGASPSREGPECEELEKMLFLRVLPGGPRHPQGHASGDSMPSEPGPSKTAPIIRALRQLDTLYTVGISQPAADSRVAA